MSAFDEARAELAEAKAAAEAVRSSRSAARNAGRRDPQLEAARVEANAALAKAVAGFGALNDPREAAQQLADTAPFVLFPVRLETRFGVARPAGAAGIPQLWVRIYPDDCSIDTFEADLTATELTNVKRYWQNVWRAAGDEGGERAAWGDLVAAHGSGRAGYLADTYQPTNLADRPTRAAPSDEFLVIPTQTALTAAEASATAQYWTAAWVASTPAELDAALTALTTAVGASRAAQLVADYVPFNRSDVPTPPATKSSVVVASVFVVFPPDPPTKPVSWTEAPHVAAFPDRFVVLGYRGGELVLEALGGPITLPLYVGPDPSADPSDAIHPDGPDLVVPDELSWLVDFTAAVAAGMGITIDLSAADAELGFDRLLVLGVSLATDGPTSAAILGELLDHHRIGRAGLSLIPQGTPAHNVAGVTSGYTRLDDADQSFADRRATPLFSLTSDPDQAADGQWLATALGIDPGVLTAVHAAGGLDQARARAMQRALWPATLGYWLDKLLAPTFDDQTVADLRTYFTRYVRGRGALPAVRIGGQAYGVLATTAFSRIGWLDRPREVGSQRFLAGLVRVLRLVQADWSDLALGVSRVGGSGDAHQILLDILGLHPDSAEYYWRYSQSLTELYNVINLWGLGPQFWNALVELGLQASGTALLARLGDPNPNPDLLQHAFFTESGLVQTVVDDRPSSEMDPVRAYTDDGRNYVQWLADTASASLDDVVAERGFTGDISPRALLYLYLRHAVLLGYYDTSYHLHRTAGFLTPVQLAAMKPEAPFIHVDASAGASESRYAALYKVEPRITTSSTQLVSDYIASNLAGLTEAADLADEIAALRQLVEASTAELERLFAEHIDTCTYRLDAWLLGLPSFQLERMRASAPGQQESGGGTGCYLGAYAWVEDLRPSGSVLEAAQPPEDVAADFAGAVPLVHDSASGGYIHAPSLPHARSAAVLRSGYLANASTANPDTLAVNLSSDRVRLALATLEGMRNGQSIGALLGYRFERGLHDSSGLAEVDKFIYPLRKAFPLVADSLASTQTPPDVPIEAIEASNVLDGRKLIARIESAAVSTYPFGLADLPPASGPEADAINAQVQAMLDVNDAIADVALAEGVHQAVQGNFDRVAATLDAYGVGSFPPDPEVVQTPAPGIGLTHRVAVHLQPGLTAPAGAGSRAVAEPSLESWLGDVLPASTTVGATVTWTDPLDGVTARSAGVTLADLGLGALDIVELVRPDDVQAMTVLDDLVLRYVLTTLHPRADAELHIQYRVAPAGTVASVFEVGALIRSVRSLLTAARPLRATDLAVSNAARPDQNSAPFADRARIDGPKATLDTLLTDLTAYLTPLQALLADPVANRTALVSGTDAALDAGVELLRRAALLGVAQAGWGFCFDERHQTMSDLYATVRTFAARCDARLAAFDVAIADYDALPVATSDTVRFNVLQAAEAQVVAHLDPLPPAPATMRVALPAKRAALAAKRAAAATVPATNHPTFGAALAAAEAILPVDDVDPQPLDFTAFGDRAVTICADVARAVAAVSAGATVTAAAVAAQLTTYAAATNDADRVTALAAAAKALFGSSFLFLPDFGLPADQVSGWTDAVDAGTSGALVQYLTTTVGISEPVLEWATGTALVRPAMHAWESVGLLAPAFGRAEPSLTPAQVPYTPGDPWLAMQFPADFAITTDRLLYTACYTHPFDATARQCGLLVDEWTEVIPSTTKDTGLTFQFDRPDNEPPQAILVVTPATADGVWHWEDLTAALNETLDLAKLRAVEPADTDPTPYSRLLPATVMAVTLHGISITTALAAVNGVLLAQEVLDHACSAIRVGDMQVALSERLFPSVTMWNRLEGRPRTQDFQRALQAEVRDALWMLSRQWQLGEFRGSDAGSPVFAKVRVDSSRLTRYRPGDDGPVGPFDQATPFEAHVEQRPVPLRIGGRVASLDLRLAMGRQWQRLVAPIGPYAQAFVDAYPVVEPDPGTADDAAVCSEPPVFALFAAASGRLMDGGLLYEHLLAAPANHAYDGVAGIAATDHGAIDAAADAFLAWFARLIMQPDAGGNDAWTPPHLEYRFAVSAPEPGGDKVYVAEEYYQGRLDWYSLDVSDEPIDPPPPPPPTGAPPPAPDPTTHDVRTTLPVPVTFTGMPNTRWWSFEERKTNYGDVDASTTDLAKLMFLEFALIYANDWFVIPFTLDAGSLANVRGLAVTNTFGERFWIEAAGFGAEDDWQRWSMFTVDRAGAHGTPADLTLLLLPTVAKLDSSPPTEDVWLIRDEVADMVWGVETSVPLASGEAAPGIEAGSLLRGFLAAQLPPPPAPPAPVAAVRYEVMSTVPENWIPFIPVHVEGSNREIQLQRAALPRILEGDPNPPAKVQPRTVLLRQGLDEHPAQTYFVAEEEVPRAGTRVYQSYQRTRWTDGRVVTWLRVRRQTGRGEGSSGLRFDFLVNQGQPSS